MSDIKKIDVSDEEMQDFLQLLRIYGASRQVMPEKMYGLLYGAVEYFQDAFHFGPVQTDPEELQ